MAKKNKNNKKVKKKKVTQTVAESFPLIVEETPEEVYPEPVARWEIIPNGEEPSTLVLYNEVEQPMSYLLLTDEHAGNMVEAVNRELNLVAPEPDEWSLHVPEDKRYTPTLNFYSAGVNTAKVPLTEETLEKLNSQLVKLYDPNVKESFSLVPWMTKNKIKTGLLITTLTLFLGYGTFTYFF